MHRFGFALMIILAAMAVSGNEDPIVEAGKKYEKTIKEAEDQYRESLRGILKDAAAKGDIALAERASKALDTVDRKKPAPSEVSKAPDAPKEEQEPQPVLNEDKKQAAEGKSKFPGFEAGLILTQYPRLPSQDGAGGAYVAPEKLGAPVGEPQIINSVELWSIPTGDRNASLDGFLLVEEAGTYAFKAWTWKMKTAMWVDARPVARYGVGEDQGVVMSIRLRPGLVPIKIVGYVAGHNSFRVLWRPEGERELVPIPERLLFHKLPGEEQKK